MSEIIPVILSGGSGTRLWPLSRASMPKQFIALAGEQDLFTQTLGRVKDNIFGNPLVVCSHEHRFLVRERCIKAGLHNAEILIEPEGRNTAAAILAAALYIARTKPEATMLVMPSDHFMPKPDEFVTAVKSAAGGTADNIVLFGIKPAKPHTGYGYIQGAGGSSLQKVTKFTEKPNLETALQYLASGNYFWNSGMFFAKAQLLADEMKLHNAAIFAATEKALAAGGEDLGDYVIAREEYKLVPSLAFDIAVMEKTDKAQVLPVDFPWNDLGSWDSLWDISHADENKNVKQGQVITVDTKNTYLRSEGPVLCAVGVDNIIAVAMHDAVLVAPRDRAEEIKHLVEKMKADNQEKLFEHTKSYRPWGYYEVLQDTPEYKAKKLTVWPGKRLSLQKHNFRSEHWVVVSGVATITLDERTFDLKPGESTYVPVGTVHRFGNNGSEPMTIIEVQTGSYFGEDDIIRFEDDFGRVENSEKKRA
ncbi:MAG: mannose-1-phosphate guanylyltransferase/mannose-6-phosphate isomerase [Alphaproteobacteria bacterium]|nr:mannose-1-phosphate guanylyltransferase/mannose-6-phosphate isomerase [Alphaproteobacteria bacterium]